MEISSSIAVTAIFVSPFSISQSPIQLEALFLDHIPAFAKCTLFFIRKTLEEFTSKILTSQNCTTFSIQTGFCHESRQKIEIFEPSKPFCAQFFTKQTRKQTPTEQLDFSVPNYFSLEIFSSLERIVDQIRKCGKNSTFYGLFDIF